MQLNRFIVIAVAAFILESCKTTPPTGNAAQEAAPVIVQLGDYAFTSDDFAQSFVKNRQSGDTEKPLTAREYFDLYVKMKLKVLAAVKEGHDTTESFKDEIATYREVLSKSYLTDKDLVEKLTHEAYDRLREEIHASHILISVPELASPADTLEAYRAGIALLGRLQEGADFGDLAASLSKDPSAAVNRGDLGSFTAFQMLYPFETAAYRTSPGQLSGLTRTVHGYHILKVHSRRPGRGKLQVAHIMVRTMPGANEAEQKRAADKINEAYQRLARGEAWGAVVSLYSEDKQSAQNEGVLPVFGIGAMVKPFEDAAFGLGQTGDFTKPVRTEYGWHIIRLIRRIPLESFEEMAPALRQKVVTDSRGRIIDKQLHDRLRVRYPVRLNENILKETEALTDSSLLRGRWNPPASLSPSITAAPLFLIADRAFDAQQFLTYLKSKQKAVPAGSSLKLVFERYYNDFVNLKLTEYEKDRLEDNYPEFRQLMSEIRDGVLLSKMMEKNVWERSLKDSLQQRNLYEQDPGKYRYPDRARGLLVTAQSPSLLEKAVAMLSTTPYPLQLKGEDLIFRQDASELPQEMKESLRRLVSVLAANPSYVVEINAYRDEREKAGLALERLRHAVKYLTDQRIGIDRIVEKNHDAFRAFPDPDQNRRLNFVYYSRSAQDIASALNKNSPGGVTVREGYFTRQEPEVAGFKWEKGIQSDAGKSTWLRIDSIEPARNKTFAEARGAIINAYQQTLETQWLDRLRGEFPVKVNEDILERVSNELN